LPSWWLARLAWLARPAEAGETASADGLVWYPLERLFFVIVGLGAAIASANLLLQVYMAGGFEPFIARMTNAFKFFVQASMTAGQKLPNGVSVDDFARFAVTAALPQTGGFLTLTLALNFWLASRISAASSTAKRPWMPLPDHLRLPTAAAIVFAVALGSTLLSGLPRMVGMTVATAFGMGFALQGFATLHALTRGHGLRPILLSLAYSLSILLQGMPLLLMALFGVADTYWNLRGRAAAQAPKKPE
jgi:hypothetical protein